MKIKQLSGLDCAAPAEEIIRVALRAQLRRMCGRRDHALNWSDPDGVHDMRVMSRRMRSAISDFQPHLRKPGLSVAKLRSIARSLGAVRDEDVALAALEELKAKAPDGACEGIEILEEERRRRQAKARSVLKKAISTQAIKEFRAEFQTQLRAIATTRPKKSAANEPADAVLTFRQVGSRAINTRLKEFRSAIHFIYFPFKIKEIHELRILAKRLRYAVEVFGSCWGENMNEVAKEIATIQTSLGELHDCDVWIEYLGARLKRITGKRKNDLANQRATVGYIWLLRHFSRRRGEHYRDALARWQQWETEEFLDKLKWTIES